MKYRIIPIFIPNLGCPFKCLYCDQEKQTGTHRPVHSDEINIFSHIDDHLRTFPQYVSHIEIAFFGGTFTGLDRNIQKSLLQKAFEYTKKDKRIKGIRISTHPLMVDLKIIRLLKKFPVHVIELGIQSFDDDVLKTSGRSYTSKEAINAYSLLKEHGFQTGIQLMTGLPSDNEQKSYSSALMTAKLKPHCVRIYPTIVFKDTPLAKLYSQNKYQPESLQKAVSNVKKLLLLFKVENIPVIRAGIHPVTDVNTIIDGPYHPAFRSLCEQNLRLDLLKLILEKPCTQAVIRCSKAEESYFRGIKNQNIILLKKLFPGKSFQIEPAGSGQPEVILDKVHHFSLPMEHLKSLYEQELKEK